MLPIKTLSFLIIKGDHRVKSKPGADESKTSDTMVPIKTLSFLIIKGDHRVKSKTGNRVGA